MTDIVTERSGSILRIQFNRPAKKNAMTFAMYNNMADLFKRAMAAVHFESLLDDVEK